MRHLSVPRTASFAFILYLVSILLAAGMVSAQATELPGLGTDALVIFDSNGVPHVCTGRDDDTFFMQGYLHARDRFFQMDTLRKTFSGRLAELVGQPGLASDVQFRTFGLRRGAEESLLAFQEGGLDETLAILEAYTAGVNAWLSSQPLPPEYGALELTSAEPWTVLDSLTVAKGLGFGLSFDLLELDLTVLAGAYGQAGAVASFDGLALLFEDVMRHAPFDATVSIPSAAPDLKAKAAGTPQMSVPSPRTAALAKRTRDQLAQVPRLEKALNRRADDKGSNWWLVSGERSESGHAMLANDPHLGLGTPSTFYEIHLISSAEPRCGLASAEDALVFPSQASGSPLRLLKSETGLKANGVSFAGAPGLVQGCNDTICWGSTVNPMDVTDVYQEVLVVDPTSGLPTHTLFDGQPEPILPIPQNYQFNVVGDQVPNNLTDAGIGPLDGGLTLVVPRRNNGPILSIDASQQPAIAFSVQYTGWRGTVEFEAFRRWLKADDMDEFVEALQYFDVGSQNWAYADTAGNIGYFTSAEMPLREDLQSLGFPDGGVPPFLIRDGSHTLRHEWMALQGPAPAQQSLNYQILPFAEMPQVRNPTTGYVINANNDPVGTALDNNVLNQLRPGGGVFYLSPGYVSLRVGRIGRLMEQLLADGNKATAEDLKTMQANNQLLDAELLAPHLINSFAQASLATAPAELQALANDPGVAEAITRLMAWDFSTPTGLTQGYDPNDDPDNLQAPDATEIANSVAATIWSTFRGQAVQSVIDNTLIGVGLGDFLPDNRSAFNALANLLMTFDVQQGVGTSGIDFFQTGLALQPAEERDLILLQALRAALDLLASDTFAAAFGNSSEQNDYRWGYLHRITFDHILGQPFSVPNSGGFSDLAPDLPGVARAGGYEAVDASRHSARADGVNEFMFGSGPARRFVGVLDPQGIQADQILPGGQSGVLGSPHYASQLGRWLTNDYHSMLFSAGDVVADQQSELEFVSTACRPAADVLCFQDRRFAVTVDWQAPQFGSGAGWSVAGASNASGNFWFFDPENWEMLVKVLDGCQINGNYWVFASGATDVGWELTVEDTETGEVWTTSNPLGQRSPAITDTAAFATCP